MYKVEKRVPAYRSSKAAAAPGRRRRKWKSAEQKRMCMCVWREENCYLECNNQGFRGYPRSAERTGISLVCALGKLLVSFGLIFISRQFNLGKGAEVRLTTRGGWSEGASSKVNSWKLCVWAKGKPPSFLWFSPSKPRHMLGSRQKSLFSQRRKKDLDCTKNSWAGKKSDLLW